MDIGSIFLILALFVLVAFFISQPFLDRRRRAGNRQENALEHERSGLLAERDRVLNALQELDFDNALEKIPAEDYPAQRARLLQYGAEVLRKLDEFAPLPASGKAPLSTRAEDRLEASLAARRADGARLVVQGQASPNGGKVVPASVAAPDDDLEVLLATRRRSRQEEAAGFCPKCGSAVQKADRFCPKCGERLV
jgi:hypothetical protein